MTMKTDMMDKVGDMAGRVTMTAGAASAVWGWLTVERIFSLIGVLCGVAGLLVTWYYKSRADQRAEQAHAALMEIQRARVYSITNGNMTPEQEKAALDHMDTDLARLEKAGEP
ncbi:hypothetical protein ADJ79_10860 [Ottowia sp. oral taxon 894]|uniref:HP1 family phage holin n=1 Tax=Ottowia sp. oral taxon 894 TaxID=1658672 RepID=UPI0006812139|nr:holin [Ottowia sp. oral taxon 894]AKU67595.1 hypothetical protein ADJ79_10860 [Ottowia sp. oral taxon 894]